MFMNNVVTDKAFVGSIPKLYEEYLVPMIFESYARDLVDRVATRSLTKVLEIAAGTGVVTRKLAIKLPDSVDIVATDLNQPMLTIATEIGTQRPVQWRQADAMQLPFDDSTFDAVVCQFGVMFFPDKSKAFAEARRVLRPDGAFIFNVWDRIEENEFTHTISMALDTLFPTDPPRFMQRVPHGYYDLDAIMRDLKMGGFKALPKFATIAARSKAASPRIPATAFCQGTPLRNEIEARGSSLLDKATDIATAAIAKRFGSGAVEGKIQAHVIIVER
jgi:ubiquinone/menaquinone biosynthesis C-methylase UbiE